MFQSKALKETPEKKHSKLYDWWLESRLVSWWYRVSWDYFFKYISHAKKMYGWYVNVFRFDYDFDFLSIFAIIEYKLKRTEKALFNGHAVHEDRDLKALTLAIKLAARLKDDDYDKTVWERIEKRWGKFSSWTTPCEDDRDLFQWHSKYEKVNSKEDEEKHLEHRKELYDSSYNKMKRDEKNLYAILHKYGRNFWD